VNPFASFDCLAIAKELKAPLGDSTFAEIHLFAYLACLLSLYKHEPVADWGYSFAGTKSGAPFSPEIADSMEEHVLAGFLLEGNGRYVLSDVGESMHEALLSLEQNRSRLKFLNGACTSAVALPIGVIRNAVSNDASIKKAIDLGATRPLLDQRGVDMLYEQFSALSAAIGVPSDDLMLPSIIWVSYLAKIGEAIADTAVESA
jgi:hypothetical protein